MSYDLLLLNANCVVPKTPNSEELVTEQVDIGIKDGKITALGSLSDESAESTKDLKGLHILPGVIDSQVHFREPGLTHKEDLETGTAAAALGGVTAVFEMPNTSPSTTNKERFDEKKELAKGRCYSHYAFFIGASPENKKELKELERLPGCVGVKVFMGSSTGSLLVENDSDLEDIFASGYRRIAIHAEDEHRLRSRKSIAESKADVRFHPVWRDETTALDATKRLHRIAKNFGRPAHLLHVSTRQEMEFLYQDKGTLSVEVLPQHLTLSAPECYERLGTLAQMNPPIRDRQHQDALWRAIKHGLVDVIGSDHAPHTLEEKNRPYPESPSGMPGVQTLVPVMLNHVNQGRLSLEHLVRLICQNPAKLYGARDKGVIRIGADADLTIIDLQRTHRIENSWIATKAGWTPFDGMSVQGWPVATLLKGQYAMEDGKLHDRHLGELVHFEGEKDPANQGL